jgi:hypothetical protein
MNKFEPFFNLQLTNKSIKVDSTKLVDLPIDYVMYKNIGVLNSNGKVVNYKKI